MLQLVRRARQTKSRIAVRSNGVEFSFQYLLDESERLAMLLLAGKSDLQEARVGFMIDPGVQYVIAQWAIWRAGGIAVPLCVTYPLESLAYVIEDSEVSVIVVSEEYRSQLIDYATERALRFYNVMDGGRDEYPLPYISLDRSAMILYTSGTTGSPKGVVTTHANIDAQIRSLVRAWQYTANDCILNVLPMHHVHGIINVTCCMLWVGACVEFLPKFSAKRVFEIFLEGRVNVFMAVPTIYYKLLEEYAQLSPKQQSALTTSMKAFRLMVSGSAALPISIMEKWEKVSGQRLLERYGMTEIGMAISNPYDGERRAGHIGRSLPAVRVRMVTEEGEITKTGPGELQIQGPTVFKEYYNRPEATAASFTDDGWFKTGDMADRLDTHYRILGRMSVDIIKSGGYKISALEIEEKLRSHEQLLDCAVVGITDEQWGELVVAAVVVNPDFTADASIEFDGFLADKLPRYKRPSKYIVLNELPRNAMGKVTKPAVKDLFV